MYIIEGIDSHFGFRREGDGRVIYLFNGEVDYSATEQLTDTLYTDENDDGEVDFSEYDPSILDTETLGELEDELSIDDLIEKIGTDKPSQTAIVDFFKKEVYAKQIPVILVDIAEKKIKAAGEDEIEKVISENSNLNIFIREYDHLDDY